jgi:hypothetical protein
VAAISVDSTLSVNVNSPTIPVGLHIAYFNAHYALEILLPHIVVISPNSNINVSAIYVENLIAWKS